MTRAKRHASPGLGLDSRALEKLSLRDRSPQQTYQHCPHRELTRTWRYAFGSRWSILSNRATDHPFAPPNTGVPLIKSELAIVEQRKTFYQRITIDGFKATNFPQNISCLGSGHCSIPSPPSMNIRTNISISNWTATTPVAQATRRSWPFAAGVFGLGLSYNMSHEPKTNMDRPTASR